jgi:hypothetical protein
MTQEQKQELAKILVELGKKNTLQPYFDFIDQHIAPLIEAAAKPVTHPGSEPPEHDRDLLVHLPGDDVWLSGYYDFHEKKWVVGEGYWEITHWMEQPPIPQQ